MPRKPPFPREAPTRPKRRPPTDAPGHGAGGRVSAARKAASEAPTDPPPPPSSGSGRDVKIPRSSGAAPRITGVRPKKRGTPAAVVDEVTADLSRDPRRDEDE